MKMRFLPLVSLFALALAAPVLAHDHDDTHTVWRVFVADHKEPKVVAFDLEKHEKRWTFATKGQSKLYAVAGGNVIAAVQSNDDQINFIQSGVHVFSHGDHSDIEVKDPAAITATLNGPQPFHVLSHDGTVSFNFDKAGYTDLLSEKALIEGKIEKDRFEQAHAHHGFVTPFGKQYLVTIGAPPAPEGEKPAPRFGLQTFDNAKKPVGEPTVCTAIHGEAFSGKYLAAGCKEGVLTVREGAKGAEFSMLPYPADLPQGTTGTLIGAKSMQIFLGNYGANGLMVIDPADKPHFTHIALPFRRVDFTLDQARPQLGYVLTEDGSLHRINLIKGSIEHSAKVTEPYSMEGHWNDPRPRLAVAGSDVLVTDPLKHGVHVVDSATLKTEKTIAVEGMPYNLVVVGGSGMEH